MDPALGAGPEKSKKGQSSTSQGLGPWWAEPGFFWATEENVGPTHGGLTAPA